MIEGLLYGIIVSLAFVGIVSLIYFFVLYTFRPKSNGIYIIKLTDGLTKLQIYDLIFAAQLRNMIYGGTFCSDVIVLNMIKETDVSEYIVELLKEFTYVKVIDCKELSMMFE